MRRLSRLCKWSGLCWFLGIYDELIGGLGLSSDT